MKVVDDRSGEAGFTLIELLVAIAASTVVIFALSNILIGTLRSTQGTFTRVSATRQGRTAMADIENELHSSCIGAGATGTTVQAPIQAASTANSLAFLSYDGSLANPTPVGHVITYSATAHTLVDYRYPVTGTAPNFQISSTSTPSSYQLMTNVTQATSSGSAIPVFQYFAYSQGSSDGNGTYWFIQDGVTPDPQTGGSPPQANPLAFANTSTSPASLGTTNAADTVEVKINLSVGATSEDLNSPTQTVMNDQVEDVISLRLTTPPDETAATVTTGVPIGYGPCE